MTGQLLGSRYELLERVGTGATAEVFRARDQRLDRIVAVKVLRPLYGQDPDARARFAVEARSAAALAAPNIVPVYDFGAADDGSLFIVMRFIDGPSLRRVLSERGPLALGEAAEIGRQVADALAAAHAHGLIHRDVKPGNILLDAGGNAHLTDFGIVKALAGAAELTRAGMTFGTAAYIAPEQATGGPVGPRSDLYALGVVLYEAVAGRPPFGGDDPVAVSYRHAHEPPTPLGVLVPGVDGEFERVVMQCLEKDPERRPASAEAVAATLGSIAGRLRSLDSVAPAAAFASEPELETVTMTIAPRAAVPAHAPPPRELGVAPRGRLARATPASRRSGTSAAMAIGLLLVALLVVGAAFALVAFLPRADDGGVGDASATRTPRRTARATVPPVVPTVPDAPTPPPVPTPEPPQPTPEPPQPTPEPPIVTPEPTVEITAVPPPVQEVQARIEDELFVGDFHGDEGGTYHGRTASWVYGQGTPFHTMTANFQLTHEGQGVGRASLEIVGLDGENPIKNRISITLNGVTLYEGPNPLPDDACCGPSGPGNWGSVVFEFPGEILAADNTLVISNLEQSACTTCPKYVMVDFAVLSYRVRP